MLVLPTATATAASSAPSMRHASALAVAGSEMPFFGPDTVCLALARVCGRRRAHSPVAGPDAEAAGVRSLRAVGLHCMLVLCVPDNRLTWAVDMAGLELGRLACYRL